MEHPVGWFDQYGQYENQLFIVPKKSKHNTELYGKWFIGAQIDLEVIKEFSNVEIKMIFYFMNTLQYDNLVDTNSNRISEFLDMDSSNVRRYIRSLREKGFLTTDENGRTIMNYKYGYRGNTKNLKKDKYGVIRNRRGKAAPTSGPVAETPSQSSAIQIGSTGAGRGTLNPVAEAIENKEKIYNSGPPLEGNHYPLPGNHYPDEVQRQGYTSEFWDRLKIHESDGTELRFLLCLISLLGVHSSLNIDFPRLAKEIDMDLEDVEDSVRLLTEKKILIKSGSCLRFDPKCRPPD